MTKLDIKPSYASVKPAGFYVYIHLRTKTLEPFYVGKGSGNRGWHGSSSKSRSILWHRCALKNGVTVDVVQDGMTEDDAYLLEEWLIAKLRHEGCVLYNISEGGAGGLGLAPGNSKPVVCSNGMRFETTGRASEWALDGRRSPHSHSMIYMCCTGRISSAHGYSWWYDGDDPKEYVAPADRRRTSRKRVIFCSNGMSFDCTSDAARWLRENGWPKASYIAINAALRGRNQSAYGLSWWDEGTPEKKFVDPKTLKSISVTESWKTRRK